MSYVEFFEKSCPIYMSYGMTYDQYWNGDVYAHKAYKEAHKMKLREINSLAHLQAAYIYGALCNASSLFRGMKPSKPHPFRTEPFDIFPEDVEARKEKEAREKYERIREKVAAFAKELNKKNHKEREVDSDAG